MKKTAKQFLCLMLAGLMTFSSYSIRTSAAEPAATGGSGNTTAEDTAKTTADTLAESPSTTSTMPVQTFKLASTTSCNHSSTEKRWQQNGTEIDCKCMGCKKIIATINLNDTVMEPNDDTAVTPVRAVAEGYTMADDEWTSITILYRSEGSEEEGTTTVPTDPGKYEMYLEFTNYKGTVVDCDPVLYQRNAHSWKYTADGFTLSADCTVDGCDAHASVTLDTASVYEASRNYKGSELDYEVYYENGWSDYFDIEPYTLLYYGTQTISRTSTEVYGNCFKKPTSTGNYEVCAAVLTDKTDPSTYIAKTERKSYYLADIAVSSCEVLTYGETQIAQFTKPSRFTSDGAYTTYYVGTLDELLWVVYHGDFSRGNIEIFLTNDIVVNPITVDDEGHIRSASYQIYVWPGFGSENSKWSGRIWGNGHIIYGLYQNDSSQRCCGLVNYGNADIKNLTIENSMLYGNDVGAFIGKCYEVGFSAQSCKSLNNYICGRNSAGGVAGSIIAYSDVNSDCYATIKECGNNSIIKADTSSCCSGGICGYLETKDSNDFWKCYNLGAIEGGTAAGGLVGKCVLRNSDRIGKISWCFNTGSVNAASSGSIGGLVGMINSSTQKQVRLEGCASIGYLYTAANVGGLIGYCSTSALAPLYSGDDAAIKASIHSDYENFYYGGTCGTPSDTAFDVDWNTELTTAQAVGSFICGLYGHTQSAHWTVLTHPSCTGSGEFVLKCEVCGEVLQDKTIGVLGHHYDINNGGKCVNCGLTAEEIAGQTGSVFTQSVIVGAAIAAAGVLIVLAGAWLIIKKKKTTTQK